MNFRENHVILMQTDASASESSDFMALHKSVFNIF